MCPLEDAAVRLLVVSSGSLYSTTEVHSGLCNGLRAAGAEVIEWDTAKELAAVDVWARLVYERQGRPVPRRGLTPGERTAEDKEYMAGVCAEAHQRIVWEAVSQRVDVVLFVSGHMVPDSVLWSLSRRHGGPVRTGLVFTESPYEDRRFFEQADLADFIWTNDRGTLDAAMLRSWITMPSNLAYLPMAYDPTIHTPRPKGAPEGGWAHDVVFVGVGYEERVGLLESIDWSGIDLGLYGDWRRVNIKSPLYPFVRQGLIPNAEASDLYRRSKVGLNLYRTTTDYWNGGAPAVEGAYSLNPRAYELAACRVPQVSQARPEFQDVFPGDADWSYEHPAQFTQQIRLLLSDDSLRESVADAQFQCVQGHSYNDRALKVLADIEAVR